MRLQTNNSVAFSAAVEESNVTNPVPGPSTLALFVIAIGGIVGYSLRRKKAA